jgi:Membrane bound O-acyl transferase family
MFVVALMSIERTFTRRPLRRYELLNGLPVERQLSFSNVLIDACDLLCNPRGFGWSWSRTPLPRQGTMSPSITSILVKLLLKCTLIDASQYIIHIVCPSVNNPGGGSLFNPNLGPVRSAALAAFAGFWGWLSVYASVDAPYHVATLIGRIVFRQPASHWPPFMRRPWMSTSLREFWSYRWHQALRHVFTVFGARPGGALLGLPGAVMGAFGVSAVLHHIGLWGLGKGMEFSTAGGFFLFMGLGVLMEEVFKKTTGLRVRGLLGWLWTILWINLWGTLMLDGWARHGMFVNHSFPDRLRLGKYLVDTVIALSGKLQIPDFGMVP